MKTILILENGKVIKNMLNRIMNKEYKIIKTHEEMNENLVFANGIPDLVIADLTSIKDRMIELLINLKNNPVISFVPFLLITTPRDLNNNRNIETIQISIFNHYLSKPFSADELASCVNGILDRNDNISPW